MPRVLKALRWLTAVGSILVLTLFAWQCVDIYLTGNSPANLDANGVHLQSVYRMEDVIRRLSRWSLPLMGYCVLLVLSVVMHVLFGQRMTGKQVVSLKKLPYVQGSNEAAPEMAANTRREHSCLIRMVLCGLAILFIVLGVMNGGWYDVLVKAINICTECIGLG